MTVEDKVAAGAAPFRLGNQVGFLADVGQRFTHDAVFVQECLDHGGRLHGASGWIDAARRDEVSAQAEQAFAALCGEAIDATAKAVQ